MEYCDTDDDTCHLYFSFVHVIGFWPTVMYLMIFKLFDYNNAV